LLGFDLDAIEVTPGLQRQLLGGLCLLNGAIKLLALHRPEPEDNSPFSSPDNYEGIDGRE
jgi:hypothetical protein